MAVSRFRLPLCRQHRQFSSATASLAPATASIPPPTDASPLPPLESLIPPNSLPTGAESNAYRQLQPPRPYDTAAADPSDCIVRGKHPRAKNPLFANSFKEDLYPTHPHNFTPLRGEIAQPGFSPLDRAIRDVPWESRFELVKRKVTPHYCSEPSGTPRREYQEGMVEGMRVRPVFNPYVELTPQKRYVLDNWASRDWRQFDPLGHFRVRGGQKKYLAGTTQLVPRDIAPTKDELGEWHPPRLSGRYKGDIQKQFAAHSLPWMWKNNFYSPPLHFMDRTPRGPKRWYKKEFRQLRIAEAMRKMPELVEEYRKERRKAKRLSWFEKSMVDLMGNQIAGQFIRKPEQPKF